MKQCKKCLKFKETKEFPLHSPCRTCRAKLAKIKRHSNINHRLATNLRGRIYRILKYSGKVKGNSHIRDLGCTVNDLIQYIESLFQPGMTWQNYGDWEIDHITPLSKIDLTNNEELKKACHFSNLQPLWMNHNRSKSNKTN